MSGGTYTLNGSVNIITGQGQDGVYTLNSSGDDVITQNSGGGVYTLYPGSYTNTPAISSSGNQTLTAVMAGIIFGNESAMVIPTTTDTITIEDIKNTNIIHTNRDKLSPYYRNDRYTDTVQFGRGISTYPEERGMGVPYINWLLIKIIIIGLLILLLKLWNDYRKSL